MTRLLALAAIFASGIGGYALWTASQSPNAGPSLAAYAQDADAEVDLSLVTEMSLGNPDADVTVVEYASFTCPHCKTFHEGPFKELKADYIDTGKIHFIYREVYFDRFGLWAGMIARCAGEMRYFGVVDMLYDGQRDWIGDGQDPVAISERLKTIGKSAGMSQDEVDACMTNADLAQAMVAVYQQNAEDDNVRSTPSLLVNGEPLSGNSYAELKATIDQELGS
ncbi:MAG: DsbA family protein [Pseudomonadota bacterium]